MFTVNLLLGKNKIVEFVEEVGSALDSLVNYFLTSMCINHEGHNQHTTQIG